MRSSSPGSSAPGCVVVVGQPGTRTVPPATSADARNGAALDRSGSTRTSRPAMAPGATRQMPGRESSTVTPAARSTATVISMCGSDGRVGPMWRTVRPCAYRAAASSRPETNWLEPDASTSTEPPVSPPRPCTVNGSRPASPWSSTRTPRARNASSTGPIGRA